jgi:hypothetical protein
MFGFTDPASKVNGEAQHVKRVFCGRSIASERPKEVLISHSFGNDNLDPNSLPEVFDDNFAFAMVAV